MTGTTTRTQTWLRMELLVLEMQSLADLSVKNARLQEIIAYCVPQKYLRSFTILGKNGNEAHIRLDVAIDYDEHDRLVRLSGDGLPNGFTGEYGIADGSNDAGAKKGTQPSHCPHMAKAVGLCVHLIREKGLQLEWSVQFREKAIEMARQFDLVLTTTRDCTGGGIKSPVTNSVLGELTATMCASEWAVPAG